jgi:hypothetical protein
MLCYLAHGLIVRSQLALPALPCTNRPPEVTVVVAPRQQTSPCPVRGGDCVRLSSGDIFLFGKRIGCARIQTDRITLYPYATARQQLMRHLLLGRAMAVLLHIRKKLVLHASTVGIDGAAVAILGDTGAGKSTLAAELYLRGHVTVSDDVTSPERVHPKGWRVSPAFRELKLWPGVAAALEIAPRVLARIHSRSEKRVLSVGRFAASALPLRCIYVIGKNRKVGTEPLEPSHALTEIIRHSYCLQIMNPAERAWHFVACGTLAAEVPVRRLYRTDRLADLHELARLVERDSIR